MSRGIVQESTGEPSVFSEFVQSYLGGGEPSPEQMDRLWEELRRWLIAALKRRSMWSRPPVFLGVVGFSAWVESSGGPVRGAPRIETRDALDELTHQAFCVLFIDRKEALARYVRGGQKVGPILRVAIRNFLHDLQRRHDPQGSRSLQWLRSAVARAVEAGSVRARGDEGLAVTTSTVLVLGGEAGTRGALAEGSSLASWVGEVNNALFERWLTARGREGATLVEKLAEWIPRLREHGVEEVEVKTLLGALQRDLKQRQASMLASWASPADVDWRDEDGESPEGALDEWRQGLERGRGLERYRRLDDCVRSKIDGAREQQRVREAMHKIWALLGVWARASTDAFDLGSSAARREAASLDREDPLWLDALTLERLPGQREIGRLLGMRHGRVQGLMGRLRGLIEACAREMGLLRSNARGADAVRLEEAGVDIPSAAASGEAEILVIDDLRARARPEDAGPAEPGTAVGEGSVLFLDAEGDLAVEWIVLRLEDRGDARRAQLVAADPFDWLGTRDLRLGDGPGSLTARLELAALELPAERLPLSARDRLAAESLASLRAAVERVESGHGSTEEPKAEAFETDIDPDYRDWMRALEAEKLRLEGAATPGPRPESLEPAPEANSRASGAPRASENEYEIFRGPRSGLRLAAMLLVALGLGLLGGLLLQSLQDATGQRRLEREIEKLQAENRQLSSRQKDQAGELAAKLNQLAQLETDRQRDLEAFDERLEDLKAFHREEMSQVDAPRALADTVYVPEGVQRGFDRVTLDPADAGLLIQADVRNGDTIRVLQRRPERLLFEEEVSGLELGQSLSVVLPRHMLDSGEIRVLGIRDGQIVTRFSLVVEVVE
ncbi:MAG: hypothetical protein AAF725_19975 [Acidobacteriota bacterium]